MMINQFLDNVPYWLVFVGYLLLFALSIEAGFRLGRWKGPSADVLAESRKAQAGTVLGAMLALVGFLVAFTFGMAGSQYDARRKLVIDEANAIGTTYLRAAHMPEPHRSNIRRLLREYAADRQIVAEEVSNEIKARAAQYHEKIWTESTMITQADRTPVVAIFLQSLNETIDIYAKRVDVVLWKRIPDMLFVVLAFLSIVVMVLYGYWMGWSARRHVFPTALLVVAYATVFLLVVDLDRPRGGFFRVSHQPLIELSKSLDATAELQPLNESAALLYRE